MRTCGSARRSLTTLATGPLEESHNKTSNLYTTLWQIRPAGSTVTLFFRDKTNETIMFLTLRLKPATSMSDRKQLVGSVNAGIQKVYGLY